MDLKIGGLMHGAVYKIGFYSHICVAAIPVDVYAKCKAIGDATQLFEEMPKRDLVSWTVMIGACAECGNAQEALDMFDRMREVAMVNVVNACAKFGVMHKARIARDYLRRMGFPVNGILGTALIDMYAKCGSVECAREIFDCMSQKNIISWSAMIGAYGYLGESQKALDLFNQMLGNGRSPNQITFVSLLYACSHSLGLHHFSVMREYGIRPDVKHFTCLDDLLGGHAGKLDQALNLIEDIETEKDAGLWGALLGGCRIHGHMELAEKASEYLVELQPQNAGHYALLSNIYAKLVDGKKWRKLGN